MSIVCFIIIVAALVIFVGDLSLITATDLQVNWAPEPLAVPVVAKQVFNKTQEIEVNQWEVFEDPTALVEPKNVKPVAPAPKEVIVEENHLLPDGSIWITTKVVVPVAPTTPAPLEVAEISLRGLGRGVFSRHEPVYFV